MKLFIQKNKFHFFCITLTLFAGPQCVKRECQTYQYSVSLCCMDYDLCQFISSCGCNYDVLLDKIVCNACRAGQPIPCGQNKRVYGEDVGGWLFWTISSHVHLILKWIKQYWIIAVYKLIFNEQGMRRNAYNVIVSRHPGHVTVQWICLKSFLNWNIAKPSLFVISIMIHESFRNITQGKGSLKLWKTRNAIMPILSLRVVNQVDIMTTYAATGDDKFVIMTALRKNLQWR